MPDTIAAIATASAAAAVGIVRLSGAETRRVLAALFTPVNGRSAAELPPRRMTYGTVRDAEGRTLDHALAVVFSAGHSYTGEESAELHCHGSPVVLQEVAVGVVVHEVLVDVGDMIRPQQVAHLFVAARAGMAVGKAVAECQPLVRLVVE